MRVLVGVDVRRAQSAVLKHADLRCGFGFNFRGRMRPVKSRDRKELRLEGKRPVFSSTRVGISRAGSTGSPSTSTMWHPTPNEGFPCAIWMASAVAAARAIRVALVSTPDACNSTIARFTPQVRPKSSAFTIKRLTG